MIFVVNELLAPYIASILGRTGAIRILHTAAAAVATRMCRVAAGCRASQQVTGVSKSV